MKKKKDKIRFGPELSPGVFVAQRVRGDQIEVGAFSEIEEGKPLAEGAEILTTGDPDSDGWQPITDSYRHGPAQIATPKYCAGYDRIFGKRKVAEA